MSVSDTPSQSISHTTVIDVIDSDPGQEVRYKSMADRLGLGLRFYRSYRDYLDDRQGLTASCTVISVDGPLDQVVESVGEIAISKRDQPLIIASDLTQAEAAFDLVTPNTIAIIRRPINFDELEGLVAFAVRRQQFDCELAMKHDRFEKTIGMLTERQSQILDLLTQGIPNKTIATQLEVSQRTIETDRARILKTFRVETTTDLALLVGEFRLLKQIRHNRDEESKILLRGNHRGTPSRAQSAHQPHSGHAVAKPASSRHREPDSCPSVTR